MLVMILERDHVYIGSGGDRFIDVVAMVVTTLRWWLP
ncbi:unnamed protein product [Brassica oleracea var. botrytis]